MARLAGNTIITTDVLLAQHDREIRNKAIDEFANKCKEKVMQTQISRLEWFEIDEIARELKGGAE